MLALATAFRLFFLLAGLMAALWIPAWVYMSTSGIQLPSGLGAMGWHAHEMVFGYAGAVLGGFLLTAARVWTNRETLRGAGLAVVLGLWMAGRVTALHGESISAALAPAIDGSFFAAVAAAIGRPIVLARSWRNAVFVVIMLALGACDIGSHVHLLGVWPSLTARSFDIGLDCIALVLVVFGGRVIPMFTRNATGADVRQRGHLDNLAIAAAVAAVVLRAAAPTHTASAIAMLAAGVLNAARMIGWSPQRCWRQPILWVLHAAWAIMTASMALSGLEGLRPFAPPSALTHLFAIGGMGLMTLGMMARVALGHTGRELRVPTLVALAFGLVVVAAVVRVAASAVTPVYYGRLLWLASAAWCAAFISFSLRYSPILLSPRVDGKPG